MFARLLIANRGEIACRIERTARRLGIETIAVFSDSDADAPHVKQASRAIRVGPTNATESYLNISAIIEAALKTNADAIHPGYGFLSENPEFARACSDAGIRFVGPSAKAIRQMGAKQAAIETVKAAGVTTLPSSVSGESTTEALIEAARRIGFPLMVKPNAGGGGKGMHIVQADDDLSAVLERARREARGAFDDDHLLLERYLPGARHIEVQIFADQHGNVLHLFERDCSMQRRHQKVVEESPAPNLSSSMRTKLCDAAVSAARSIDYLGAGTVEFLVKDTEFFFLEMNTRLQVEHPVTELVTGIDLVEWQLRVACGEPLPLTQQQVVQTGHAIEARIYAEDPDNDFLPATGPIRRLRTPEKSKAVRIDSGIEQGTLVTADYDPMLLKLCSFGPDRDDALRTLSQALLQLEIVGCKTNTDFIASIMRDPTYRSGDTNTGILAVIAQTPTQQPIGTLGSLAAAAIIGLREHNIIEPFVARVPWRLNAAPIEIIRLVQADNCHEFRVTHEKDHLLIGHGNDSWKIVVYGQADGLLHARVNGIRVQARVTVDGDTVSVRTLSGSAQFNRETAALAAPAQGADSGLRAPLPGVVLEVHVQPGQHVESDASLMIIEAMKMEHTILSPRAGMVQAILFAPGDRVDEGTELLTIVDA
ncbi:MAG: 3-methylcrotonyl-CoA carboxylase [Thiotrichales bacterium]|nr:3-methylcrotonyl-CoA carboxylase [Thiotrichales bacterium]